MNKLTKQITAAVTAAALALTLTACGGGNGGTGGSGKGKNAIASKEHVYSAQKIEIPDGFDYINTMLYADEKFYIIGEKSEFIKADGSSADTAAETTAETTEETTAAEAAEDADIDVVAETAVQVADDMAIAVTESSEEEGIYVSKTIMRIMNIDGTVEKDVVLVNNDGTSGVSSYISNVAVGKDGTIFALQNYYEWNETTGESKEDNFIVKFGSDGTELSKTSLSKVKDSLSGDEYFYVDNFIPADDGTFIISSNNAFYGVDESGALKYTIKNENANDNTWMSGLYKGGDGRLFTSITTSRMEGEDYKSETQLYEIDTVNKKLGTSYPYSQNGTIMSGTEKYDLLISRDSGLYGYDVESGNSEIVIDWLKSGIDTTAMNWNCTTVLPDGRVLCVTYDYEYNGGGGYGWSNNDLVINILTEVKPEDIPDKKLVKLYAIYLDLNVKRQILQFNKTNQEYEIELTSYEDYAVNDYFDAVNKLNNDLISGNVPDILVIDSNLPVNSYISKGLFADLYEYMDKDETLNRSDYVESLFKACEVNGKLYELVPSFGISTIIGKTSDVGAEQGWTMADLAALADANPDKSIFGDAMSSSQFFNNIFSCAYESFIDPETGKCAFNSEDFIGTLEFAKRFPKEVDYNKLYEDPNYWNDYQSQYRNGKTLLYNTNIYNFINVREIEQGTFGAPVTFKGYPGVSGSGSVFTIGSSSVAMSAKSSNPDGAWSFIKYFLSEEYQDQISYNFPIKKSSLEKLAQKAKEKPFYMDENDKKVEYDNEYWLGNESIKIGVNTDEDNQRVMDLINSTTQIARYDRDITKIIEEETAAFFEGQKSAQEVADIIQNRAQNYIDENR